MIYLWGVLEEAICSRALNDYLSQCILVVLCKQVVSYRYHNNTLSYCNSTGTVLE